MPLDAEQQRFADAARQVYDETLRSQLEAAHHGKIIAVEPESGDYVLGTTIGDVDAACRERFGSKPVHTFRVGGGGAVKIGGACFGPCVSSQPGW